MCKNMQLATCYDVSVNSTLSRYLTFAPVIFKPYTNVIEINYTLQLSFRTNLRDRRVKERNSAALTIVHSGEKRIFVE